MSDILLGRSVLSVFLSLAAAACIYLILLNRFLLLLEDGTTKTIVLRGSMFAIGFGAVAFGWRAAASAWMLLPIGILAAVLAGEAHRLIVRRRCAGAPPVEAENVRQGWLSPITTTDLAVLRYELAVPGWHGHDLRIAHVSDLHLNGDLSDAYYGAAMARVAQAQPDLLIYTGDLVTKVKYAPALPALLSQARGRLATLAILGNHDYWVGAEQVAEAVRSAGVTLLGDACVRLPIDGGELWVCGDEGPWSACGWQPPRVTDGALGLMLTHTPDNVYRLSGLGYAAIFAGHYHAGQIRLPGLGPLVVPSRYGRRLDHGHFVVDGTHLFVTAGIGSAAPPRRIYCQPDIFIVDVRGDHGARDG